MDLMIKAVIHDFGFFELRWYSVLILVGIIIALIYCKLESKRFNIPWDFFFNMAFWTIIVGFIGARVQVFRHIRSCCRRRVASSGPAGERIARL